MSEGAKERRKGGRRQKQKYRKGTKGARKGPRKTEREII